MSRGGALMGKRALVTQVTMSSHTNREGFTVDPFWGATAPPAIAGFGAAIQEGGREKLRAALGLAVQDLEGTEIEEDDLLEVGTPLFVGARAVLAAAVRANAQESDLVRDLGGLKIQEDHMQDILMALSRGGGRLTQGAQLGLRFPAVDDVRWRVDVTISTTALSRVLRPSVLLQMELSDGLFPDPQCVIGGSLETFSVSAEKLQTLRYDVACALRSLQDTHASPQLARLAAARSPNNPSASAAQPRASALPAAASPAAKPAAPPPAASPPVPAAPSALPTF